MKKFLLVFLSFVFITTVMAQNYWSAHVSTAKLVTAKAVARKSFPATFKLFDLDINPLRKNLFSVVDNVQAHTIIISLPNVKGELEKFEVNEASNFDKKLQARFPMIRAFSGRGITDKSATLKLSLSPQGISTMIFRTATDNEFIESYSADQKVYAVFKSERTPGKLPWTCSTEDVSLMNNIGGGKNISDGLTQRSGANLKTLRLAQSVTAEYSNYFGATSAAQVGLVLAAINATITRCNGVYEKDLAIHLNLIDATTNVIYYDASTDPYSNASTGAAGKWNTELQKTLTAVIGEANYDIGHLFGATGGGGNAGCIGCVCNDGTKGKGFTSPADGIPEGDNFDIDYVVHEVGHQLGANHTFSYSNEGTGANKEIGSGITIMGYAGITAQDVAAHSIDIYHEESIAQIQANIITKSCPVTYSIVNSTPVVNAVSNYTIPLSTPFALTGSATDADAGDVLTYCWEEDDNATSSQGGVNSRASTTKASGPNWISFPAIISPTRYFPQLSTILTGGTTTGPLTGGDAGVLTEALSSVARTLNFRLTVRDNAPYSSTSPISVGQTNFTDMTVTVSSASGPFTVTAPNTAVNYAGGSTQTITWNVAGTTASPVNCANVKISLSTDGGQTFPTVLAASTPNDGSQAVTIPNTPSTTARIKIEAIGNIFFDISNANFTIGSGASCGMPTGLASSNITTSGATVSWTAVSGATSYAVDYKLNTSSTWASFSTAQTATSATLTGLTSGSLYDWRVTATCASGTGTPATAQFTTTTSSGCQSSYDVSTNGTTSGAAVIPFNADVTGLISASGDLDYYKFIITSAGTITITLSTLPKDYDLKLFNSAGTQVAVSQKAGTNTETINYTAAAGTYYAEVYGYRTNYNATSCYTLRVGLGTASKFAEFAMASDKKIFSVFPNPVHSKIYVNLSGYKGTSHIELYDVNGKKIAAYNTTEINSELDISKYANGVYMLKIITAEGEVLSKKIIKE